MVDRKHSKKRRYYERLYNINVLPDGNLNSISTIDIVNMKLEDPPLDESKEEKGSV